MSERRTKPVLVTGSTGYVGGRLAPQLLASGYRVRVLGRSLSKLRSRPWAADPGIELAQGDVLDYESMTKALKGCWAAYYLVHSMNPKQKDFAEAHRRRSRRRARSSPRPGSRRLRVSLAGARPRQRAQRGTRSRRSVLPPRRPETLRPGHCHLEWKRRCRTRPPRQHRSR